MMMTFGPGLIPLLWWMIVLQDPVLNANAIQKIEVSVMVPDEMAIIIFYFFLIVY